jgi:hypothetical protein
MEVEVFLFNIVLVSYLIEGKKPLWIIITDNHSDESCWNCPLNRIFAKYLFLKYDLDMLVFCCPPPGQSKFNPVEHVMSFLSKSLVDVSDLHENVTGDKAADINLALDKVCSLLDVNWLFIR